MEEILKTAATLMGCIALWLLMEQLEKWRKGSEVKEPLPMDSETERWQQMATVMAGALAACGDDNKRARARVAVAHAAALQAAQDGDLGPIMRIGEIADTM